jgi:hypothetical protein
MFRKGRRFKMEMLTRIIDTMQETEFPSFDQNDYFEFKITPKSQVIR